MAMAPHTSDRLTSAGSAAMDRDDKLTGPDLSNRQDVVAVDIVHGVIDRLDEPLVGDGDNNGLVFSSSAPQPGFYKGVHNQDSFLPHLVDEGFGKGFGNDNTHPEFYGLGLRPQLVKSPYAHLSPQQPSVWGSSQFQGARAARLCVTSNLSYNQQLVHPNTSSIPSLDTFSHSKCPINTKLQMDAARYDLTSSYPCPLESYGGKINLLGTPEKAGFSKRSLTEFGASGLCPDWSTPLDRNHSFTRLSKSADSQKHIGPLEFRANGFEKVSLLSCYIFSEMCESCHCLKTKIIPTSHLLYSTLQKGLLYGFGSSSGFHSGGCFADTCDQSVAYGGSFSMGEKGMSWPRFGEARQGRRCTQFSCSCTITVDTLTERNRGPRAFKPKSQTSFSFCHSKSGTIIGNASELYNPKDFVTDYEDAKFFVIKSYSEDNVHKSIKYGVWASTSNGNKKLDAAYREAKEKTGTCPLFLFFSVNASAQFCGVAEMVGPVDFNKSVDYWLQDKWSGHFPIVWHIIKDVPNSQLRHILLENNDNRPVTNSRDTQEVQLQQGIEMLNIFKGYDCHSSILDDFNFYEERQKAIQERKAKQLAKITIQEDANGEQQDPVSQPTDFVQKMSKSFAEALILNKKTTENPAAGSVPSSTAACVDRAR